MNATTIKSRKFLNVPLLQRYSFKFYGIMEVRRKLKYITADQKSKLIEFITKHPELISGNVKQGFTRRDSQRLWQVIANELNSVHLGARKSWRQWKKTWQDMRSKTKKKHGEANYQDELSVSTARLTNAEQEALGLKAMDQSELQESTEFVTLEDNSQEVIAEELSGSLSDQDSPAETKIMEARRKLKYITARQKRKLIEFVTKHPELISGKMKQGFTHRDSQRLWQVIANELNSVHLGARKSWRQWKKTWQDMRSKRKKRYAETNGELSVFTARLTNAEREALGLKATDQSELQESTEFVTLEDNSQEVIAEELSGSLSDQDSPAETKTMEARRKLKYITARQKRKLIEFVTKHPELISGKVKQGFTHRDSQRLWLVIANELNSVHLGARKSWRQWKKTWQDMRSKRKKRYAETNGELSVFTARLTNAEREALGLKAMDQSDLQESTEFVTLEDNSQEVFAEELSGSMSDQDSHAETKIMEARRKLKYITARQKRKLIEFVTKHPELISGKVKQGFTHRDSQRLWQVIANELNSVHLGARKSWRQWKKTWQDMRSKRKKRYAETNGELSVFTARLTNAEREALGLKAMDPSELQESTEFVTLEDNSQEVFAEELSGSLSDQDSPAETKIMEARRKLKYITARQKRKLIEFVTKHPELISGKMKQGFTHRDSQRLWQVIANELNSVHLGARKSWRQWKKTWQDMRSKRKKRYAETNGELSVFTARLTNAKREALGLKATDQSELQESTEFVTLEDNSQEVIAEELSGSLSDQDSPAETKVINSSSVNHKQLNKAKPSAEHKCYLNCDLIANQEQRKVQIKEDYLNFKKDYLRQKLALLKEQTEALKSIAKKLSK